MFVKKMTPPPQLHIPLKHRYRRNERLRKYGSNFTAKIITNSEDIYPLGKIMGRLFLETKLLVKHKGIRIQLEALCSLRYSAKADGVEDLYQKRGCVLGDNEKKRVVILPELFLMDQATIIRAGSQIFPFSLEIPGNLDLPAPFKNQFGSLSYRLAVYVKSDFNFNAEVGEKLLRFQGYVNLLNNPTTLEPLSLKQSLSKLLVSKAKIVEVELSLQSSGLVIGENLDFLFWVKNWKCIPLQFSILFVQNVKYDAYGKSDGVKVISTIVAQKEKDYAEPEPEFTWMDFLPLGEDLKPSFSSDMFTVTYVLQFKVKMAKKGVLRGETPITIGTTRDSMEILMKPSNQGDFSGRPWLRGRSVSTLSIGSTLTLPPAYSQLSSRRSSYETLPPYYDDLELPEDMYETPEASSSTSVLPDALDLAMGGLQMDRA